MNRLLDALAAVMALSFGSVVLAAYAALLRLARPARQRRIVYLGTGQIAQVFPRNGVNLFLERECSDFGGYFEHLWNVHFPAGARGRLDLTPRHHLVDVDFSLERLNRWPRTVAAVREMLFVLWLLRFLVRARAAVVTATNPFLQGLNAALAARLLDLPYAVIITRDFDWDWAVMRKRAFGSVFPSRRIERAVGRWILSNANLVLADREYYRAFAVRNGASPERAVATRVLADQAYAAARPSAAVRARYGLPPGPLLTYVGRLDADKFVLDLVDCLALVREQCDAHLACAGTGLQAETMRARARELGVEHALHLLGTLDLDALPALIASSDVFLAAHMGYTLVEAGMTGVPIATYDYDFHPEIIRDGVTGRLVPFRDVRALANAVIDLLRDPGRARRMGSDLRDQLVRDHSLQAVVPLYRRAYDLVLGGRGV